MKHVKGLGLLYNGAIYRAIYRAIYGAIYGATIYILYKTLLGIHLIPKKLHEIKFRVVSLFLKDKNQNIKPAFRRWGVGFRSGVGSELPGAFINSYMK